MVNRRGRPRFFRIAKTLFWSLVMKLTPARRVLLILACVLLVVSGFHFEFSNDVKGRFQFHFYLCDAASAVAFAGTGGQSDDEARSGNRAGNSDVACSIAAAGSGWRGDRVCVATAKFRRGRLLRRVLSHGERCGKWKADAGDRGRGGKEYSRGAADGHAASQLAHDRWRGRSARRACLAAKSLRFRAQPGWAAVYDGGAWRIRSRDAASCLCERRPQSADFAPRRAERPKNWRSEVCRSGSTAAPFTIQPPSN